MQDEAFHGEGYSPHFTLETINQTHYYFHLLISGGSIFLSVNILVIQVFQ